MAVLEQALSAAPSIATHGVEMGLLIDIWERWGTDAIAQVAPGERRHRNRLLAELGPPAREVIAAALAPDILRRSPL